jgi:restriction system protein
MKGMAKTAAELGGSDKGGAQFVRYFGPLLDALRRLGDSATPDEATEQVAETLELPDSVQNELMASGEPRFRNQVHWARFYLAKEGLIDSSKRGVWSLTDTGRKTHLTYKDAHALFLKWVKIHQEMRRSKPAAAEEPVDKLIDAPLPVSDHRSGVIDILLRLSAKGFEKFSQRLLRESGFTTVIVTGQSGDGGIDGNGTLQINELVSFKVLFQCKRYKGSVSPSAIRDFRGAMAGRADKGIVITTGSFTAEARREASRDGVPPIELIDGERLVDLLERLELGLRPIRTYEIDEAFFNDF